MKMKMKKTLLLFIAFYSLSIAYGQTNTYHPFSDSAIWRVDILVNNPQGGGCLATYYFHYYSSGDTLINSLIHKKIYKSFVALTSTGAASPCNPLPPLQLSGYIGALRDDSVANKTFFVFKNETNDSLLFDYNLNANDTLKGFIGAYCTTVVSSVDSVMINGHYRKRWNCNACGNSNQYIIEGIGTSYGLTEIFVNNPVNPFGRLICSRENTNIQYASGYNSLFGCELIYNGIDELNTDNNFKVFPNPFSSSLNFESDKTLTNAYITVYNIHGQNVKQIKNISGRSITLHRDNLPDGLYFFCLMQDHKVIFSEKLIITDY